MLPVLMRQRRFLAFPHPAELGRAAVCREIEQAIGAQKIFR
jgi:hypothetical protein